MIQLNLLPDVKKEFIRAQRTRNQVVAGSIIAMVGSLGLIVIFVFIVYAGQKIVISNLTNGIKDKSQQLKNVEDIDKYLTVQNQLRSLDTLHEDKQVYSRLMDYLVVLNPVAPNSIQLDTLEVVSDDNTVVFKGSAASAQAFNVFKDTLVNAELSYGSDAETATRGALFSEVTVQTGAIGRVQDKTVFSFVVKTTYDENAFLTSTSNVRVSVPNIETTQSVLQAPVFNSAANSREESQ